jgi:DNA replication protein DnaC
MVTDSMQTITEILGRLSRAHNTPAPRLCATAQLKTETAAAQEQLRRSLQVSSLEHTFANFKRLPGTDAAYRAFLAMSQDDARPLLLCYGGVGNGKSYLCEALTMAWYGRGLYSRVFTMAGIMGVLKRAMRPENAMPPLEDIQRNYCRSPRLIVDDVGMGGSGSAWEYGQMEEIVSWRYRERLPTVMTTNQDVRNLPERIFSRFCDPEVGSVVLNDGEDYRRR